MFTGQLAPHPATGGASPWSSPEAGPGKPAPHPAMEQHGGAAEHYRQAAKYHDEAARHYAEGHTAQGAEAAHHARGHAILGADAAEDAARSHATYESSKQ